MAVQAAINNRRRNTYFQNVEFKRKNKEKLENIRMEREAVVGINNNINESSPNQLDEFIDVDSSEKDTLLEIQEFFDNIHSFDPPDQINVDYDYQNNYDDTNDENHSISMSDMFESAYLIECADILKDICDPVEHGSDDSDSDSDDSVDARMESLDISRIKDFRIDVPVNKLVNTLIFNIRQSTQRNVSHLYSCGATVSEHSSEMYVKEMNDWFCTAKVAEKDKISHANLIKKYFPISEHSICEYKEATKYEDECVDYLEYDCCDNGCIVYAGEYKLLRLCPKCPSNLSRFIPCNICLKLGLDGKMQCSHHASNRTARRTIRYRSIKLLLVKLLQYESFREALKYRFVNEEHFIDEYCSSMDGESHRRNMKEMEEQFNIYKASSPENTTIKPVYIMSSWFYDAVQVFGSVTSDMAPMYISFQNLPHCLRTEHGVGSFLLSLFTFKKGSAVEDFLMNDCFIAELSELAKGFDITIEGIRYFVLLRLIAHIQDLMGFNSLLKVQNMAKSHQGCIFDNCGGGRSIHFSESNHAEPKYDGQRRYISMRHPTRTNGYSRQCCPPNYYKESSNDHIWVKGDITKVVDFAENQVQYKNLKLCTEDKNIENSIKNFLNPDGFQCPYNWFDTASEYSHYKKYLLWYPHACYIPRINYIRTTNEELLRRATLAILSHESVEGVKAAWSFLAIHYVRFETDVSPSDPMHDLKNIFHDLMNLWKNDKSSRSTKKSNKGAKEEVKKAKKSNKTYIEDDDESNLPPWAFKKKEQTLADCYMNCILLPFGFSKFNMPPIFGQTGNLKISQIIKVFTVFINLVLLASNNMKFAYKQHHRMFASIVNRMRAPTVYKLDILPMYWRAREWLCLFEGLYPVVEMTIMKHFIPDVILHIPNQGPLHTFHTLFGEMLIGVAKRKIKRNGGTKVEIAAYKKIFELENMKMKNVYGTTLKTMMDSSSSKGATYKSLSYDTKEKIFKVDFRKNDLTKGAFGKSNLISFEFESIVNCIVQLVEVKFKNVINHAITFSSFYRVIFFLKKQKLNDQESIYTVINRLIKQSIINIDVNLIIDDSVKSFDNDELIQIVENGKVIRSDIKTLTDIFDQLIQSFKYKVNGLINGISYHARGFGYSQKVGLKLEKKTEKDPNKQILKDFSENREYCSYRKVIKNNWFKKAHYSCWCKLNAECYAQLNYFFTLKIEKDFFVSSLHFASVSSQRTIIPDFTINYEEVTGNELYNETLPINHINLMELNLREESKLLPLFVEFSNILSTEVASIGFVKRGFNYIPIDCGINIVSDKIKDSDACYNYKDNNYPLVARLLDPNFTIEILGLIDLSPEKINTREKEKIHDEIKWIDSIWDNDEEEAYILAGSPSLIPTVSL